MRLVVYGEESLDELQSMVTSCFSEVPNHNYQPLVRDNFPLEAEHFGKLIRIKTLTEMYFLKITWQMSDMKYFNYSKPWKLLKIISREYENSLLSILKTRGWVVSIDSDINSEIKGISFCVVQLSLTKEGLDHYLEIVTMIFKFINLLKSSDSLKRIMNEFDDLDNFQFNCADELSPLSSVTTFAHDMHQYSPTLILKGPHSSFYGKFSMDSFLKELSVENFRIVLASRDDIENPQIEKWYKTEYSVESLSEEFITEISSLDASYEFSLPTPNRFIPAIVELKPLPFKEYPSVTALVSNESAKLWYIPKDMSGKPSGVFTFSLFIPVIDSSDLSKVKTELFISLGTKSLRNIREEASLANLNLSIGFDFSRLIFRFDGFSGKLHDFIGEIMRSIMSFIPDPTIFEMSKQVSQREARNQEYQTPFNVGFSFFKVLIRKNIHFASHYAKLIDGVSVNDILAFRSELFKSYYLEAICYGNFLPEDALSILESIQSILNSPLENIVEREKYQNMDIKLENGQEIVYVTQTSSSENSAIILHLQTSSLSDVKLRSLTNLYARIFESIFFDQLRTKEQLGYIVAEKIIEYGSLAGLMFGIQSKFDPVTLHERIEEFLSNCPSILESMSMSEFEGFQQSYRKTNRTSNQAYVYPVFAGHYEFDRWEKDSDMIESFTKNDILDFVNAYIVPGSPQRKMIAVHVWNEKIGKVKEIAYADKKWQVFNDANELKRNFDWCPEIYTAF